MIIVFRCGAGRGKAGQAVVAGLGEALQVPAQFRGDLLRERHAPPSEPPPTGSARQRVELSPAVTGGWPLTRNAGRGDTPEPPKSGQSSPTRTGGELIDSYPWHLAPDEAERMLRPGRADAEDEPGAQ